MPLMLHFALLRRRLAVWLVVLVALFGALAPTLSHALALARGGTSAWTEVCTSTGTRWVMMGSTAPNAAPQIADAHASTSPVSTTSPDGQEAAFFLDHCPFCLLSTDRAAPPPNALLHLFVVLGEPEAPTLRQAFFFVTHFALTPPLRGPPASL
ncbi:MAG: DUF2946 family protein [Rhodoferax sp.]|uniref:DUF2946 family protein n=1 Tax=Rhodoferax sp. TaxID=50421 RepID=UPI00185D7DAD|nr:DUF2946 family protein [Rhodoferax sp.]NMM14831.1 DUF2946 family protein [Rhodoferax sp.]NMM18594.1 DUF2946 family protein [Rhodoferax sp.]